MLRWQRDNTSGVRFSGPLGLVAVDSVAGTVLVSRDGKDLWRSEVSAQLLVGAEMLGQVERKGVLWTEWIGLEFGHVTRRAVTKYLPVTVIGREYLGLTSTMDAEGHRQLSRFRLDPDEEVWSLSPSPGEGDWDWNLCVKGERVFLVCGQSVLCVDAQDGRRVWRSSMHPVDVDLTAGKAWPIVDGGRVFVNGAWGIKAFDTTSGEAAWHYMHSCWKTVAGGRVYCLSKDYAVLDARTGEVLVFSSLVDRIRKKFGAKSSGRWRGGLTFARPVVWGDHVYFGDDGGRLWAIEKDTGEPVWFHKPKDCTGYLNAEPMIDGNRLYIASFSMDPKKPPALYCYERA